MDALLGRWARNEGDEAAAAKDGTHESIVKLSPIVMDRASGPRQKHA